MSHYFETDDRLFFVMPYLKGGSLRKNLKINKQVFTEDKIKHYAVQIILGVQYLHSSSVVHRDLKPDNLMFDDRGYIKIIDYSHSTILDKGN